MTLFQVPSIPPGPEIAAKMGKAIESIRQMERDGGPFECSQCHASFPKYGEYVNHTLLPKRFGGCGEDL